MLQWVARLGASLRADGNRFLNYITMSKRAVVLFPMSFEPLLPAAAPTGCTIETVLETDAASSGWVGQASSARVAPRLRTIGHAPPRRKKSRASVKNASPIVTRSAANISTGKMRQPANFAVKLPKLTAQRAQTRILKPAPAKRSAAIITFPQPIHHRQLRLKRAA
jgi:hypothetical protein